MPTEYMTDAQFLDRLQGDLASRSTPDQRARALTYASSDADEYLSSGGYAVPVTDPPAPLVGRVADIATWHLAVTLRLLPEPAKDSSLYLNYKAAQEWLAGVSRGAVALGIDLETAGETVGAPSFATNTRRKWEDGW